MEVHMKQEADYHTSRRETVFAALGKENLSNIERMEPSQAAFQDRGPEPALRMVETIFAVPQENSHSCHSRMPAQIVSPFRLKPIS